MSKPREPQPTYGTYPPVGHVARSTTGMSFGDAVRTCFSKYVDFSGRARRSEYWYFALCEVLVLIAAAVVDRAVGGSSGVPTAVAVLAFLLPSMAARSAARMTPTAPVGGTCSASSRSEAW